MVRGHTTPRSFPIAEVFKTRRGSLPKKARWTPEVEEEAEESEEESTNLVPRTRALKSNGKVSGPIKGPPRESTTSKPSKSKVNNTKIPSSNLRKIRKKPPQNTFKGLQGPRCKTPRPGDEEIARRIQNYDWTKDWTRMQKEDKRSIFKCLTCGYIARDRGYGFLLTHIFVHTGEMPYKCQFCDFRAKEKQNRDRHETLHTGVAPFQCPKCLKKFAFSQNYRRHLKSYKNKDCRPKKLLENHEIVQGEEEEEEATESEVEERVAVEESTTLGVRPKALKSNGKDSEPIKFKEPPRKSTTSKPLKLKSSSSNITIHKKPSPSTISGRGKFKQPRVGDEEIARRIQNYDWTKDWTQLKKEGQGIYKCLYCDFTSQDKSYLLPHIFVHTGEMPYECQFCDYRAKIRINRDYHEMLHTGDAPNQCSKCLKRFARVQQYNRHLKRKTDCRKQKHKHLKQLLPLKNQDIEQEEEDDGKELLHSLKYPLKEPIIELLRVEEDPSILKAYPNIFGTEFASGEEEITDETELGFNEEELLQIELALGDNTKADSAHSSHMSKADFKAKLSKRWNKRVKINVKKIVVKARNTLLKRRIFKKFPESKGHSNGSLACSICSKALSCKTALRDHENTHLGIRYQCWISTCKKRFKLKSEFYDHLKTHRVDLVKEPLPNPSSPRSDDLLSDQIGNTINEIEENDDDSLTEYDTDSPDSDNGEKLIHLASKPVKIKWPRYSAGDSNFGFRNKMSIPPKNVKKAINSPKKDKGKKVIRFPEKEQPEEAPEKKSPGLGLCNDRPFKCSQCSWRFTRKIQRDIHARIHAKTLPFECEICFKKFSKFSNLNLHLQLHSNSSSKKPKPKIKKPRDWSYQDYFDVVLDEGEGEEMSYKCRTCKKILQHENSLSKHHQTHKEKPHGCSCGARYAQRKGLLRHQKLKSHFGQII